MSVAKPSERTPARPPISPLIGRDDLLQRAAGERLVLLTGEPGAGKTRLLAELRTRATEPIVVTVRVHRDPGQVYEPLSTLVAAAERKLVKPRRVASSHAPDDAVQLMALRDRFEAVAACAPLLVQLDDLQWASRATLEGIAYCIDRTQDSLVRWQLAARWAREIDVVFAPLERDLDLLRIALPALTAEQTSALAVALGARAAGDDFYRRTGGNPFYVEQLVAAAREPYDDATLRGTLDARLDELPESAAAVAGALAIANRPLALADVAALLPLAADGAAAALGLLTRTGIVRRDGDAYEFAHDLLRDAVAERLGDERRAALHRVAVAVARDDRERARHLEGAGDLDAAATAYRAVAWRECETGAFRDAAQTLQWLRRFPAQTAEVRKELDALDCCVHNAAGDRALAEAELERILTDPPRDRFVLNRFLRLAMHTAGRLNTSTARRAIDAGLEASESGSGDRALFLCQRAKALYNDGAHRDAMAVIETALATCAADDDVAFSLQCVRALIAGIRGVAAGRAALGRLIETYAGRAIATYGEAFLVLAMLENQHADYEAALAASRAAANYADSPLRLIKAFTMAAQFALYLGRLDESREASAAVVAHCSRNAVAIVLSGVDTRVETLAWLGDFERARALLRNEGRQAFWRFERADNDFAAARLAEECGDLQTATDLFERAARDRRDTGILPAATGLARVRALAGDAAGAEATLADLRGLRLEFSTEAAVAEIAFYIALARDAAEGDLRACFERLASARAQVLAVAVARAHLGARLGDRDALLTAIETFDAAGAAPRAEWARGLARERGFRPGRKRAAPSVLTEREREVADAIAEGKTNREIAEQLVISPRTVAKNVSAILEKCGMTSRVEIAARVSSGLPFERAPL